MSERIAMSSDTNGGLLSGLGRMFAGESILCSQSTVNLEITFSKKFSSGLFGGEGFSLEK